MGHGLFAVADAEHRNAGLIDRHGRQRRILVEHRGRAAGEDDRLRLEPGHALLGLGERHDLAIDARLAHAPRDELGYLAAKIEDEDGVGHGPDLAMNDDAGDIGGNRQEADDAHDLGAGQAHDETR